MGLTSPKPHSHIIAINCKDLYVESVSRGNKFTLVSVPGGLEFGLLLSI